MGVIIAVRCRGFRGGCGGFGGGGGGDVVVWS